MEETKTLQTIQTIQRIYIKITEISSMMRNGEFIVGYEKLQGVAKIVSALGCDLQANLDSKEKPVAK